MYNQNRMKNFMEEYSFAYLRAIAATSGCSFSRPIPDQKSNDALISAPLKANPSINIQIKATSRQVKETNDVFHFPLGVGNYHELIGERITPKILLILKMPSSFEDWLIFEKDRTVFNSIGYWYSLADQPPIENRSSITIRIPKTQRFSDVALKRILDNMVAGRYPHEIQ